MARLFNNLRKSLLNQGKTTKPALLPAGRYLKYAIGVIILVVIGILIALQINNWNEQQKGRKAGKAISVDLNSEFRQNLKLLQLNKKIFEDSEISTRKLMSLIGAPNSELESYNFDSLLSKALDIFDYTPTQNTLTEILAAGKLNLIESDSLKAALFEWSSGLSLKDEAFDTVDEFSQTLIIPYITKNGSLKNIDIYGFPQWKEKSNIGANNIFLFSEKEFENNLDNQAWGVINYLVVIRDLERIINKIIELTDD